MSEIKVSVFSLGCKVNSYDGDAMLAVLSAYGLSVTDELTYADVYILNTCAVTAEAEKKSRQAVTRILKINPNAKIYVCGCASQNNYAQFEKRGVEYVSGTDGKLRLARELGQSLSNGENAPLGEGCFATGEKYEDSNGTLTFHTRHFIKVQDGCNNFCSYCLVPYVRGRSRSRSIDSITKELSVCTAKEAVLTGINLSAYGLDIGSSLTELILALKDENFRIRLGSLETGVIDDKFLTACKSLKHFCPHFHLSLQSGDDAVLSSMNRKYDTAKFYTAVKKIRQYFPDAAITTDVIVGFPSEDEKAFENSLNFVKKVNFADVHVFPYSSRKGTVAGRMKTIAPDVVSERVKRMTDLKHELSTSYLNAQIGKPLEVLFETEEDGLWCGHTPNYVKVYSADGERNQIKTVVVKELYKDGLR